MSSTADRVELFEAILALIEQKREKTGDDTLAASVERAVVDSQMKEIELEIFENPGAIEPWLIRRKRGEA
jgi:hypothetical protein